MTMLERIAKAIDMAGSRFLSGENRKTHNLRIARAALTEMLEPTERMCIAGRIDHRKKVTGPIGVQSVVNEADSAIIWQAMIEAALEDNGIEK